MYNEVIQDWCYVVNASIVGVSIVLLLLGVIIMASSMFLQVFSIDDTIEEFWLHYRFNNRRFSFVVGDIFIKGNVWIFGVVGMVANNLVFDILDNKTCLDHQFKIDQNLNITIQCGFEGFSDYGILGASFFLSLVVLSFDIFLNVKDWIGYFKNRPDLCSFFCREKKFKDLRRSLVRLAKQIKETKLKLSKKKQKWRNPFLTLGNISNRLENTYLSADMTLNSIEKTVSCGLDFSSSNFKELKGKRIEIFDDLVSKEFTSLYEMIIEFVEKSDYHNLTQFFPPFTCCYLFNLKTIGLSTNPKTLSEIDLNDSGDWWDSRCCCTAVDYIFRLKKHLPEKSTSTSINSTEELKVV